MRHSIRRLMAEIAAYDRKKLLASSNDAHIENITGQMTLTN